ncbi:hypothetical protein H4R19_003775 [Coemansia spiralis]|nr:hypothetical protein H4R19_003775 [Coemansia spiralis]
MFIAYIFDGHGKYLAPWLCSASVTVADIKRYAALYLRVRSEKIALHAPDVSGPECLADTATFDEENMPLMEGWKWVIVCVAAPSMPADDELRFQGGFCGTGAQVISRL